MTPVVNPGSGDRARPARVALPIDAVLPELLSAVRDHGAAVLQAETGAGKTTRVPPALLDAGLAGDRAVIVLEPRRLAARAAARRIAEERGVALGDEVGYQVRFDRKAGRDTRLLVVTEGVLVRLLQEDPFLERFGAVVFDEFHERHLDTDLSLAMVRRVRADARADLKLVVMSATLAGEELSSALGAPLVSCAGRLHPVEMRWARRDRDEPVHRAAAAGAVAMLRRTAGDVLVFLPGVGEIRRTGEELAAAFRAAGGPAAGAPAADGPAADGPAAGDASTPGVRVVELYGDLPPEKQDDALRAGPRRRVILATNVAESSVTVEGVSAVVDTGLARVMRFDPSVGLDRLVLADISRASADQRAGRAGRLGPGVCLRLWSEHEHRARAEVEEPELRRVDLAGPVLQLLAWGERDVSALPWLEPPPARAVDQALELLDRLGALEDGVITGTGGSLAKLPVHPRLARLLVEGTRLGIPELVALAAALLAERDPFTRRPPARRASEHRSDSDVVDRVRALQEFEQGRRRATSAGEIHAAGARFVLRSRDQLARLASRLSEPAARGPGSHQDEDVALRRALLTAFPDRLARRRDDDPARAVLAGGRGVRLDPGSAVHDAELFVAVEVTGVSAGGRPDTRHDALVRQASAVERSWLPEHRIVTEVRTVFDSARERVSAVREVRFEDLVLQSAPAKLPEENAVAATLAAAAGEQLDRALDLANPDVQNWLARVRCLAGWRPELELPLFDAEELSARLPVLCRGLRSFAELRRAPLVERLASTLTWEQRAALDREAPERIEVPSGSHVRLQYAPGRPPVLPVRIQEIFGLAQTPRVGGGRIPVLLHLLGPNMRPQQVTEDLASFWANTYPEVRKELRRRYPKHAWPENPLAAKPERRPRRG